MQIFLEEELEHIAIKNGRKAGARPNGSPVPSKKIVLFSDGTGNSAAKIAKTNVWRMYQALDKGPGGVPGKASPKAFVRQYAMYDNGVGTSSFTPLRLVGGVFGYGLKKNVCELYAFLCKHYDENAEIFLFGFSRGAFTMRMLAALIGQEGILKVGFGEGEVRPDELDHFSQVAYQQLQSQFPPRGNPLIPKFREIREKYTQAKSHMLGYRDYQTEIKRYNQQQAWDEANKVHSQNTKRPEGATNIKFMGLFDTVSAYGGPIVELTKAFTWMFMPVEPKDWNIGRYVEKVCHALALDETRESFTPKLIDERMDGEPINDDISPTETPKQKEERLRILQVWFTGAHSNIGGGYANDGLSMVPLSWMIEQADKWGGLNFSEPERQQFHESRDACAPINDPRRGIWGVYRFLPRNLRRLTSDKREKIYTHKPKIHQSVIDRMGEDAGYAPIAINRGFRVFMNNGKVIEALPLQPKFDENFNHREIDRAWDLVWTKRVTHGASLFLSFFVIALFPVWAGMGLLDGPDKPFACSGLYCSTLELFEQISGYLPSYVGSWFEAVRNNFRVFFLFLILWLLVMATGGFLSGKIKSALARFWYEKANVEASEKAAYLEGTGLRQRLPAKPGFIQKLRSGKRYQTIMSRLKETWLPIFWGTCIVFFAIGGISQIQLYVRNHGPADYALCSRDSFQQATAAHKFNHNKLCNDTAKDVKEGEKYLLTVNPGQCKGASVDWPWLDWDFPFGPSGLGELKWWQKPVAAASFPFRRHPTKSLMAPVIQIGTTFPAYAKLKNKRRWIPTNVSAGENSGRSLSTTFIAPSSGRAFYYVNDVIWGGPGARLFNMYSNNCGNGRIHIQHLPSGPVHDELNRARDAAAAASRASQ